MFHLPVISNTTTTAYVPTYPTSFVLNASVPSVVYQTRLSAPVFATEVPMMGVTNYSIDSCSCRKCFEEENQKKFDDFLSKKISEQLKNYHQREEKNVCRDEEKCLSRLGELNISQTETKSNCCDCNCDCGRKESKSETKTDRRSDKNLTIDEKIDIIREELNLPPEKDDQTLSKQIEEYNNKYSASWVSNKDEIDYNNPKAKFEINYIKERSRSAKSDDHCHEARTHSRSRSRSKSAKSRSPSAKKPWIPTGANDYTNTHYQRSGLLSASYKKAHDSSTIPYRLIPPADYSKTSTQTTKTNCDTQTDSYIYATPKPASTYYTVNSYTPSKTIIKTTIDSTNYIKNNNDGKTYYNVITEKHLPKASKSVQIKTDVHYNSKQPTNQYAYVKSSQPQYYETGYYPSTSAKEYVYYPNNSYSAAKQTSKSYSDFKPVERTLKGAIYSSNNELHYVSDQAARNWSTTKDTGVRITNAGTTFIHE